MKIWEMEAPGSSTCLTPILLTYIPGSSRGDGFWGDALCGQGRRDRTLNLLGQNWVGLASRAQAPGDHPPSEQVCSHCRDTESDKASPGAGQPGPARRFMRLQREKELRLGWLWGTGGAGQ